MMFGDDSLPDHDVPGVLQLGMNCCDHGTALTVADLLNSLLKYGPSLPRDVLSRLFVTAAARQHSAAMEVMIALPAVMCSMDAATISAAYRHLLGADDWKMMEALQRQLLAHDLLLQIDSDAVVKLLHFAINQQSISCLVTLRKLPAVRTLGADALAQLLQAAVEERTRWLTMQSCWVPAAPQLTLNALTQLLETALEQCDEYSICALDHLLRLPAAKQLSVGTVEQALQVALTQMAYHPLQRAEAVLDMLIELPAVEQLSDSAVTWLAELVQRNNTL
jgi:hypothetical protein